MKREGGEVTMPFERHGPQEGEMAAERRSLVGMIRASFHLEKNCNENASFSQFLKRYETCRKSMISRSGSGYKIRQMLTFHLRFLYKTTGSCDKICKA
ncbi:hypothetical protein ABEX25_19575 [Paenibacillus thiaminolyticus]|uniref:hypothetical protein n=1 Tax=Paenibacillus thiaminolyticus TaxID=49283 RepID=UPI003D2C100C